MEEYSSHESPDEFAAKIHALIDKLQQTQADNRRLTAELEKRTGELESARADIVKLKNDYGRLKLAKAFGLSENSKKQAHNRISKLVRDIDTCIALLKK